MYLVTAEVSDTAELSRFVTFMLLINEYLVTAEVSDTGRADTVCYSYVINK